MSQRNEKPEWRISTNEHLHVLQSVSFLSVFQISWIIARQSKSSDISGILRCTSLALALKHCISANTVKSKALRIPRKTRVIVFSQIFLRQAELPWFMRWTGMRSKPFWMVGFSLNRFMVSGHHPSPHVPEGTPLSSSLDSIAWPSTHQKPYASEGISAHLKKFRGRQWKKTDDFVALNGKEPFGVPYFRGNCHGHNHGSNPQMADNMKCHGFD